MNHTASTRAKSWRRLLQLTWVLAGAILSLSVDAQVRLPNPQLPQLPPLPLPANPGDTLRAATEPLDPQNLRDLRRLRIREMLRVNRTVLETDPNGAPIVRAEIVAYAPTEASLQLARDAGYTILRESTLPELGIKIVILAPRTGVTTRTALRRLRSLDPGGGYDYNHLYIESGVVGEEISGDIGSRRAGSAPGVAGIKIGLIDTGIDRGHPSLQGVAIEHWGCDSQLKPAAHGTAVASLLVGHDARFTGAAPTAFLYAADVYCAKATGGSIDRIAIAFAWLAEQRVPVINVSLVGPPNVLLEKIVAAMLARGHLIVAAVGNDGPTAPPLYPAAYPGVIGVTGVDQKRRVLLEAVRGPQVYFSAPGADMSAAGLKNDYVAVRGTSFAAPIVSGLLARRLQEPNVIEAQKALAELVAQAIDLGARGVDKIYGHGLVGEEMRIDEKILATAVSKK